MRVRACGDAAALIELADLDAVLALHATVQAEIDSHRLPGLLDVVPAARTVLLRCIDTEALVRTVAHLRALPPAATSATSAAETVTIPVTYDGEDLAEVADLLELTPDEVVARHTGTQWRAAFTGFAPGFAYLVVDGSIDGSPDGSEQPIGTLEVPRRAEPRTRVPAGSVGLAGEFSGVYPRPSPGGWQLIGRTDVVLWDAEREGRGGSAALLRPGAVVRFEVAP